MEPLDQPLVLTRFDSRQNMARFYILSIEPTLFGAVGLRRNWGRVGTWGQCRLELHPDAATAKAVQARAVAAKLKKGYLRS